MSDDTKLDPELLELKKRSLALEIECKEQDLRIAARNEKKVLADADRNGRFVFIGEVTEGYVHTLMARIEFYCQQNPDGPVEIVLNSPGGSVLDGLALVDYLRAISKRGHRVTIVAYGMVASMAGIILQAADERVMMPRCWLGMHEVSSMAAGTVTIQEDRIKFTKQLQAQCVDLICSKSELTPLKLKRMFARKDVYVSAAEALKLGLCDRVEEI